MLHNNDMPQVPSLVSIALGLLFQLKLIVFIILSFYRSPTRTDSINNNSINNRLRRTLASRSMSAEVFRSSIDTVNSGS